MSAQMIHVLDLELDAEPEALELFAEELQPHTHAWSDCLSTGSSFSSSATAASFSSVGSVVSTS